MNSQTIERHYRCVRLPLYRSGVPVPNVLGLVNLVSLHKVHEPSLIEALLHPDEKRHYEALNHPSAREVYLHSQAAMKRSLLEMDTRFEEEGLNRIRIVRGVFRYPVIRGTMHDSYELSLSHTKSLIGVSIAKGGHPIGIDLLDRPVSKNVLYRVLSASEVALGDGLSLSASMFSQLMWTVREALSKALRSGFSASHHLWEVTSLIPIAELQKGLSGVCYEVCFRHFFGLKAYGFCFPSKALAIGLPMKTNLKHATMTLKALHSFLCHDSLNA